MKPGMGVRRLAESKYDPGVGVGVGEGEGEDWVWEDGQTAKYHPGVGVVRVRTGCENMDRK